MVMKCKDKDGFATRGDRRPNACGSEALLRAEISFWRELLDESAHSLPPDSIERMRQALGLAERRFLQLVREAEAGDESSDRPRWTSLAAGNCLH